MVERAYQNVIIKFTLCYHFPLVTHGGKLLVDILPNPWGDNLLSHYHNRDHQVYQEHRFNSHAIMPILFIRYIGGTFKDNSCSQIKEKKNKERV